MKVLLSAYSCTPNLGSEPGVGWNWARQIAKNNEVWVITRETNRKSIESAEKPKSLHFVYVDSRLPGLNKTKIYYIIWQLIFNQMHCYWLSMVIWLIRITH